MRCEGPSSLEEVSDDDAADIAISRALLDFPARARRFPDEDSLRIAFPRNDERRFCVLFYSSSAWVRSGCSERGRYSPPLPLKRSRLLLRLTAELRRPEESFPPTPEEWLL